MHTAKRKKLSKILFKKKIKTLVSIQTRSRLNHHYETHQYEKALYFAFMLSATNWNCLVLMVNSHEKKAIWLWNYKATTYTHNYFYWHQWKLLWIKLLFSCYKRRKKKNQIFLVHNVSNSTAFSNSLFYKKNEKKN